MKILKISLILCSLFIFLNASSKYKYSYKNLEYLNLNKSKISKIKEILLDLKYEYKEFYKYKEKIEDEIEDLIENEDFDEELYVKKVMNIKTKATLLEAKRIKKIHNILNKEQKDEFADHFKEWKID